MTVRFFTIVFIFILAAVTIAEAQDPDRGDIRIVVISDMNESFGSTHYGEYVDSSLYLIERWQPDAILTGGDQIAGQSLDLEEENIYAMWDAFDEIIAQPIYDMGIPFGITMGNHDASGSGSFDHERDIAEEYFTQSPTHLNFHNRNHFPFYFSFSVEDLFVISWDASAHQISTEERDWVADQLNSDEARGASYRILIGHLPLYAVAEGRNRYGEILEDADELFELLKKNGLDIYISGHHHAYYPAKKEGVLLLSAGAIGSGPRPLIGSDLPPRRTITLIDFFEDSESFVITTYDPENEMEEILPEELPESIEGINGILHRYDLIEP